MWHQRKANKLFPEKQRKDLMCEKIADGAIMEVRNTMKSTIRGRASFGHQDMDMGMEVDAVTESLDHGHHSWHELQVCGCVQEIHKCTRCRETEIIEELSIETEEQTQHIGNSKIGNCFF